MPTIIATALTLSATLSGSRVDITDSDGHLLTSGRWDNGRIVDAPATLRIPSVWWAWHDADDSRWSADTETAEARCAAWCAGTDDDGPDTETIYESLEDALTDAMDAAGEPS